MNLQSLLWEKNKIFFCSKGKFSFDTLPPFYKGINSTFTGITKER
ncbi:hypothetical protein SAMN04487987_11427 [Algibacter pectinivorans]|uniref:Uncharacterized protein n=1 Tax=Algibacter pectinivorans TaxID=870482 RepID=A0A1I1S7T3_9FLAO|nr:hypothetical protein SAMN04487987_11427 [Algibacter pectinivorans]